MTPDASALAAAHRRPLGRRHRPELIEYIRVPAKSPHFDPRWEAHGHIERVIRQAERVGDGAAGRGPEARDRAPAGPHAGALLRRAGATGRRRTHGAALRPPRQAARDGRLARGPRPVEAGCEDGKLYGRGGADDGYAVFASLAAHRGARGAGHAARALRRLIETCEESGSYDLPAYLDAARAAHGRRRLRVGLDSGCGNYEQLWVHDLAARPRRRHAHGRGADRGRALRRRERRRAVVVPHRAPAARPARGQRDRPRAPGGVPRADSRRARRAGDASPRRPRRDDRDASSRSPAARSRWSTTPPSCVLNRTWRPALVGHRRGRPAADRERGQRAAPADAAQALAAPAADRRRRARDRASCSKLLESDPPLRRDGALRGRAGAPPAGTRRATAPWLAQARRRGVAARIFGKPSGAMGEGGTIPFMGMLGREVPATRSS